MTICIKKCALLISLLVIILTILALVFCQRVFYFVDMQQQRQSVYDNLQNQQIKMHDVERLLVKAEDIYADATQSGFFNEPDIHHIAALWKRLAQQSNIKDMTFNVKAPQITDVLTTQTVTITVQADLDSDVFQLISLIEQQKNVFVLVQDITLFRDHVADESVIGGVQAQLVCNIFYSPIH